MRFEEKLRKQMLHQHFNQQKLAKASGVSDSEISRILSGKSLPGLENALKLARAVGVSVDYLADDTINEEPVRGATSPWESEVLGLAEALGLRNAAHLLENARVLGVDTALRRLLSAPGERPVIEVGDGVHTPQTPRNTRANSA
jgi:transcriptional regulator with XRE-family HTH domain